ncbi:MAG: hypothetical protein ACLQIB_26485 [Isosphaeraceae bacterium]
MNVQPSDGLLGPVEIQVGRQSNGWTFILHPFSRQMATVCCSLLHHPRATPRPGPAYSSKLNRDVRHRRVEKRLLDDNYGAGNYPTGPGSVFSKIKKWGDRAFE